MTDMIKMFEGTGEQAMLSVLRQVEEFTKNVGRDFEVTQLSTAMNGEGASRSILIAFTARFPSVGVGTHSIVGRAKHAPAKAGAKRARRIA